MLKVTRALLAEADPLPYAGRMTLFAERARVLAAGDGLAAVLADLLDGERFHRSAALFMAIVTRQEATVLNALQDPDPRIGRWALSAWVGVLDGAVEPVAALLGDAPADTRMRIYGMVRAARRVDLAEVLIDVVRERFGDREAARLLPGCGGETVARLLPELGHAVGNWVSLARRYPAVTLREAARQLSAFSGPARVAWWYRCGEGVLAAGSALPVQTLDILERFAPADSLPGELRRYGVLAAADPQRILDLLTAPGRAAWLLRRRLPDALLGRLGRLPVPMLVDLARQLREHDQRFAELLEAVAPRHRAELFDLAMSDVDTTHQRTSDVLLAVLPHPTRIAEAGRMLTLGEVRADEDLTLHYTAHLPWADAEPALLTATRRAQAEDRAAGYELLVACASRSGDPATVSAAVGHLLRLRNEQDPVRARAMQALARVRPDLMGEDLAGPLDQIVTDAVQARDASGQTLHALSALAVLVLREHVDSPPLLRWALRTFQRLLGDDRVPYLGFLDVKLRRGQETEVFAAVREWIVNGVQRGRYEPLFAITRTLGKRAWRLSELQALLHRATSSGNVSPVVSTGIALWLEDPRHRAERVQVVLRDDPSTVALYPVWRAISSLRTDLLDLVLLGKPPRGRFISKGVRWVPGSTADLQRWLPRQQRAYFDLLTRVAADAGATIGARVNAIGCAARVPEVGRLIVQRYLDSTNVNLAEAALAALVWTDRPGDALPVLLSHVDDDRARVAVYAASRASRFAPPSVLHEALTEGPLTRGKVTSRKEAVRLLTQLAVPGAAAVLQRVWRQEGQHRDVRAATVAAARQRLDDPAMWPILIEAATSGAREDVLALLDTHPLDVAERLRDDYARLVNHACASTEPDVAATAWGAFPSWAQWLPDSTAAVSARLTDLDDRSVWRAVVVAVVALVDAGTGEAMAVAALRELARIDAVDPTRNDPERDRPARRRLDDLVARLTTWTLRSPPHATGQQAVRAAGHALAEYEPFTPQAAMLLMHTARPDDLGEVLDLLADHPVTAARVAGSLSRRPHTHPWSTPDIVLAAAADLATRQDLAGGLFAVALARQGTRQGWPHPWRDLVYSLREHQIPDVRAAALDLSLT